MGYHAAMPTARIVTLSHQHPSHSYLEGVGGDCYVIRGPGEYEISGVLVIGIATFHDDVKGSRLGKNTVYLMEAGGLSVCHLGDLGHTLTAGQVEAIDAVDILMVPVGGVSTIDAARAAEVVRQLEPKLVIPMHFGTPALTRQLDPVGKFLKEMGVENLPPQPRLSVTKSSLPLTTQLCLLDYQPS